MTIADEIHAALIEAGNAVGSGPLLCTLKRPVAEVGDDAGTPWGSTATGTPAVPQQFTVTALEDGTETRYSKADDGALLPRRVRILTVSATGEAPQIGDTIAMPDGDHVIDMAKRIAPTGEALMFEVEIKA